MTGNDTEFRLLFEQAGLGIAIIDLDGCMSSVNNAFGSMLGYAATELQSRSFLEILRQEDREKIQAHFRQLLTGGTNRSTKALCGYIHKLGHEVRAQVTTTLLKDVESFPKCFVSYVTETNEDLEILNPERSAQGHNGSFRIMSLDSGDRIVSLEDITERVATERILKDSERRYRRLFEDSPISLWEEDFSSLKSYLEMLETSGVTDFREYFENNPDAVAKCARMVKVTDVNQATLDLYEAESKEALLEDLNKVFVQESLDVFREEIIRIAEGATKFEAESINVSLRGNVKHVSARIIIAPGFEENLSKVIVAILDITDKKRSEERLKASLREKEMLLSEIHHRVKNNLQIMSSLLKLQARYISDPGYKRIFLESQDRVQSMALIHEDLYESQDLGNVDFQGYVNRLVNNLFHSYGIDQSAVRYKSEIDSVSIGMDCAVPCGLIINELISNSLKYAFTRSVYGEIGVSLKSNGDKRFELTVWDNGMGVGKRFKSGKTRTLGFRLVTSLVRQLRGTIALDHCPGTKFIIRFCA